MSQINTAATTERPSVLPAAAKKKNNTMKMCKNIPQLFAAVVVR